MDPSTLETVIKGLETGGILFGASAAGVAVIIGSSIGFIKYSERKQLVKLLMPAYQNGRLTQKPNLFNIYEMTATETAHLYHTKP